jgi:glutamate-1-semialdehyde 2,1-aminomutase
VSGAGPAPPGGALGTPPATRAADDAAWRARAEGAVAAAASTGSKRPRALYGPDAPADAPLHYAGARGCRLTTPAGRTLVDCTMALGAVALGYADPEVTAAVQAAAAAGPVAGLTHVSEPALAERLCALVPCAERAFFLKSGAEAVAAAVRLARAATGRDRVVGSGYFGWLDWWSAGPGIPAAASADFTAVPFGDAGALEQAVDAAGASLAAIVLEPVVEREPPGGYLARARALADRAGAVLVFDEVKTGCRLHAGGYQAVCGVTPDLATFGKAIANGYPLAAVLGRAPVMEAARRAWISSTLASEATALAAAHAVLDRHAREDVCAGLARTGARLRAAVDGARAASAAEGVSVEGLDAMFFLRFADGPGAPAEARETAFLTAARDAGVLFKRGAYDYAALAHDDPAVFDAVGRAAAAGFAAVRRADEGHR